MTAYNADWLYGSESLTHEEISLHNELGEWCKAKLKNGHQPISLHVALKIAADMMEDPDKYGFDRPQKLPYWKSR